MLGELAYWVRVHLKTLVLHNTQLGKDYSKLPVRTESSMPKDALCSRKETFHHNGWNNWHQRSLKSTWSRVAWWGIRFTQTQRSIHGESVSLSGPTQREKSGKTNKMTEKHFLSTDNHYVHNYLSMRKFA